MAYSSRNSRRPEEAASKIAHSHVVNDPTVQAFLNECDPPAPPESVDLSEFQTLALVSPAANPVRQIIAIDGGYTEVTVRAEYPAASLCFFQFGALIFALDDLETLDSQTFIDPNDIAKLKRIQRFKLTLPIRNLTYKSEPRLTSSVRRALYDFFQAEEDGECLMNTLRWLIYQEWNTTALPSYVVSRCPLCDMPQVPLERAQMTSDARFTCARCGGTLYLTDVFRLHEAIDDELGASGILGYVTTSVEQIILAHLVRLILATKPALLKEFLFIKDGPLAFFGQTANLHRSMRALVNFLWKEHDFFCAGLEKSGAFVDHADAIASKLQPGEVLLLPNSYIYRYVLPGRADDSLPYGNTSYWGSKLIFKTHSSGMYVATLPTSRVLANPVEVDLPNLHAVLFNVQKLKCDMYDNALLPIALANKLVSLANHPSSKILQRFAVKSVS